MDIKIVKSYEGQLFLRIDGLQTPILEGDEDYIDELANLEKGKSMQLVPLEIVE